MTKTLTALYDNFDVARDVVEDLVEAGISRDNISFLASRISGVYEEDVTTTGEQTDVSGGEGAAFGAVVGGLIGLGTALIPGIGPILAAGPLASALLSSGLGAAAGAITGGVTAALVDMGVPKEEVDTYAETIRRGGAMVSVTFDDSLESQVRSVLNRHSPANVEERTTYYRQSGWTGYDPNAQPYTAEQLAQERERYQQHNRSTSDAMKGSGQRVYAEQMAEKTEAQDIESYDTYDPRFRTHFDSYYGKSGHSYDRYKPAYRYGFDLARYYRNYEWDRVEPEARRRWEERNPGTWEEFKEAVSNAWQQVKQALS